MDVVTNRDFKGAQVYYEKFPNQKKADADLGKRNVSPAFQALSDALFEWSGGKKDKRGKVSKSAEIDLNPSGLEHLAGGYLAGVPVVAKDLMQAIAAAASDKEDVDWSKTPMVRRFYKEYDEQRHFMGEYYALRTMVKNWEGKKTDAYKEAKRIVDGWGERAAEKIQDKEKDIPIAANIPIKNAAGNIVGYNQQNLSVAAGIREMRRLRRKLAEEK